MPQFMKMQVKSSITTLVKQLRIAILKNSRGGVTYSIGNIVNSIVISMYGVRWVLDLSG